MPVLNGGKFINAAIESVKAQDCDDWEMLIVDGGSTDATLDIARRHATDDARITFMSEPDKGMYDALIKGVSKTSGDWICWLNSDDLYAPWCFSTINEHSGKTSGLWCAGFPGCWDEKGRLAYVKPLGAFERKKIAAGWHHEELLGYLQQESIFFRRVLFEKLPPDDVSRLREMKYAGDFLLWRLFANHTSLDVIPTLLGGFRRHASNMSMHQKAPYWEEVLSTKPFLLPTPFAAPVSYFHRLMSTRKAWRLIEDADKATAPLTSLQ